MFKTVVLWACLSKVVDSGGSPVLPIGEVVHLVVQGLVAAAGKCASAVPHLQPSLERFGEPITGTSDFERGPVAWVHKDAIERVGAVCHEPACDRRRHRAQPVNFGRLIGKAEEGEYRDRDEDISLGSGHFSDALICTAQQQSSGDVRPQLCKVACFVRALEARARAVVLFQRAHAVSPGR